MTSEIQLEATASKFDRDLRNIGENWSKYDGPAVRCGFEAEFASQLEHHEFADKLHTTLGINRSSIAVNPNYGASHGGDYRYWSVESDSTIRTPHPYAHQIELVAPIMGLDAMLSSMSKVFDLISDIGHTDHSTGLHMTFSLQDIDLSKINVAKLALLLGEEYWAEAFDRTDTTYAVAVTPLIQEFIESKGSRALLASRSLDVDAFLSNLSTAERRHSINATKILAVDPDKQCIELRLPGGPDYQTKFSLCSRIARRFAYALYASTCSAYDDVFALKVMRIAGKHKEQLDQSFGDALAVRVVEAPNGFRIFTKRDGGKHVPFVEVTVAHGAVSRIGLAQQTPEPVSDQAAYSIEEFANKLSGRGLTVHGKTFKLSWKDADVIDWRTIGMKFQRIRPTISLLQLCGIESKSDVAMYLVQCAERGNYGTVAHLIDPLGYMYDSKDDANYASNAGMWVGRMINYTDTFAVRAVQEAVAGIGGYRSAKFCAGAGILSHSPSNPAYLTTLSDILARDDDHKIIDQDLVPTLLVLALNDISDAKMCLDIMAERGNNALNDVQDIASRLTTLLPVIGRDILDMLRTVNSYAGGLISIINRLICCQQNKALRDALMSSLIHVFQGVGYSRGNGTDLSHLPVSDDEWHSLGVTEIPELLPVDADDDMFEEVIDNLVGSSDDLKMQKCSRDSIRRALDNPKMISYLQQPDILRDTELITSIMGHWFDMAGWSSAQPNFLGLLKSNAHLANDFVGIAMQSDYRTVIDQMPYADVAAIVRTAFRKGEKDFNQHVGFDGDGLLNLVAYVRAALLCGHNSRGSVHFARVLLNDLAGDVLAAWLTSGRIEAKDFNYTDTLASICYELEGCKELSITLDHHYVFIDLVVALQKSVLEGTENSYQYMANMNRLANELRIEVRDVPAPKPIVNTYAPASNPHSLGEPSRPEGFTAQPLPLDELLASIDDNTFFAAIPVDGVSTQETAEARQAQLLAALDSASESDIRMVFAHVESDEGEIRPAMRKLFYLLVVSMGTTEATLTNPDIFRVGLNYTMFVDNLLNLFRLRPREALKADTIFGYSFKDAFYLLLTQTTALPVKVTTAATYLYMLSSFATTVTPDIVFSARSVLYFKKLLAARVITSFDRTSGKSIVAALSNDMHRNYVQLQPNRNYPLLLALAKYAGMTRTEYNHTFSPLMSND